MIKKRVEGKPRGISNLINIKKKKSKGRKLQGQSSQPPPNYDE